MQKDDLDKVQLIDWENVKPALTAQFVKADQDEQCNSTQKNKGEYFLRTRAVTKTPEVTLN